MKKLCFPAFVSLVIFSFIACKQKKKEKDGDEPFFPVLSFIKSQVAHVDTSLYSIMKITYVDSIRTDTVYCKRDQFRDLAAEFLSLPDLSDSKFKNRFIEKESFDPTLNRAILSCEPLNPAKEEIQSQEVLIRPDPTGDKVTSIIIDYYINNKDSSVQKRMLWQVNKSFQVATTKQFPGKGDTTSTYKVIWNEEDDE